MMQKKSRFTKKLQIKFLEIKKKYFFFNFFSIGLFFLFFGFLLGNIFGTFLNILRDFFIWDGLIVCFLILLCELTNYNIYSKKKSTKIFKYFNSEVKIFGSDSHRAEAELPFRPLGNFSFQILWKMLNYLKLGLLLGFFIDAFKVGS
uniref:Hypothetical chloroplast RF20 n=1 Tax=Fusochloris perforata TaxID=106203 RepID=A0A097KPV2_9CHLO|nr:hypothetical chloroplast RF20 [Fusochloris perforata]AIT95223.1 hypothetical chloroplast RF20 [Fusochloris perforata]